MKLPEDMPDPVREEERAATCLLHDQAAPSLHLVVSKQRWEGLALGSWGRKRVGHGGGYLFKCWASFLVTSHLWGIPQGEIPGF